MLLLLSWFALSWFSHFRAGPKPRHCLISSPALPNGARRFGRTSRASRHRLPVPPSSSHSGMHRIRDYPRMRGEYHNNIRDSTCFQGPFARVREVPERDGHRERQRRQGQGHEIRPSSNEPRGLHVLPDAGEPAYSTGNEKRQGTCPGDEPRLFLAQIGHRHLAPKLDVFSNATKPPLRLDKHDGQKPPRGNA